MNSTNIDLNQPKQLHPRRHLISPLKIGLFVFCGLLIAGLTFLILKFTIHQTVSEQDIDASPVVTDQTPPTFTRAWRSITIGANSELDLSSGAAAIDDIDGEITLTIDGEYSLIIPGTYLIDYVATDSSNNTIRQPLQIIVDSDKDTPFMITDQFFTTNTGFIAETINGITTINGTLIANKTYSLPADYGNDLTSETQAAFDEMSAAARAVNLNLRIVSGFRSYDYQRRLYNRYVARDGQTEADTFSARAGFSEHQTGMALDINNASSEFADTPEGQWLAENCYQFGFVLRYPEGKEAITGYTFEPWHFRYVGPELAAVLYNGGDWLTIEEYFGITSQYTELDENTVQ